ncbi:MAG: zinc ribbon domain-containing protein [Melioribacteraceae bacterium]
MILGFLFPPRLKFYLGYDKEGNKGDWEALLDKDTYDKIMKHQNITEKKERNPRSQYLLSGIGILKCGYCEGAAKAVLVTKPKNKRVLYYLCTNKQISGNSVCPESKAVSMPLIDKLVLTDIKVQYSKKTEILKLISKEKILIEKEIEAQKASLKKVLDKSTEYEQLTELLLGFKQRIDELKSTYNKIVEPSLSKNNRKTVMNNVEEIKLYNDRIEIKYLFPINNSLSHVKQIDFPKNETA